MSKKEYSHEYYLEHKKEIDAANKKWAENNKEKMKEVRKRYYQNNKEKMDAQSIAYNKLHHVRKSIRQRIAKYEKKGLPVPEQTYSFYRDTIMHASPADPIWEEMLRLDLTDCQRNLILITRTGKTQKQIAEELNVNQSSITKTWNGNIDYQPGSAISYGGIYRKLMSSRNMPVLTEVGKSKKERMEADKKKVLDIYKEAIPTPKLSRQIADTTGVSYGKVRKYINEYKKSITK